MGTQSEPVDVLIVGAGPAGLTAAIYAGRALLSTVVLEKGLPGGQLNETDLIENWPGFAEAISAPELMRQIRAQAERFGASIVLDDVVRIEPGSSSHRIVTTQGSYAARTVILAPGSKPRELPAENAKKLKGKGVSYCATCDGFFFQGKHIIQIGAGDSGLTEALFLTRFAESVTIIVRHPEGDPKAFRASRILQKQALEHPKIRFLWNRVVESVEGDDRLTSVRLRHLKTNQVESLPVDGVFVNIGHLPQTEPFRGTIDLDQNGYIATDMFLHTNIPGILAAGDARINASQYAQAIVAAGEGAIAAIEALKYLAN
ncbi:FAD-dependent oxidoreductase [Candidatus Bipolaricaulota bacterium]|nr:FAD-dependent oxidoreductase [Candidatus Bipolaricaulota bacterium]